MKSKVYPEAVLCAAWGRVKRPSKRTLAIIKKTYPVQARTSKESFYSRCRWSQVAPHDPLLVYSMVTFNFDGGWKQLLLKCQAQNA
jgi:hypothetical protein